MNNWEILALKIAIAAAVAIFRLSGTLLPWLLKRRQTSEKILVLSDTFAGGVLGGAGFIHLLNSGIEQFKSALPDVHYPVALLLTGAGFMLILLIEGVLATPRRSWQPLPKGSSFNLRHQASQPPGGTHAAYYPVILLIVLSAHSIILGLALGSQQSFTDIIIVFLAIIAHKSAAGFALGVGYARIGAPGSSSVSSTGYIYFGAEVAKG